MGRETLLIILLLLFGGVVTQVLVWFPLPGLHHKTQLRNAERRAWLRLWLPLIPTFIVGAWLCGWALQEPDPVHDPVDSGILITACLPYAMIVARAGFRAIWSLLREPVDIPICTVGFLQPRVVFSPLLARRLDEAQLQAAWEHERAHARHRDPLRIWLAQIATDLQWPWPSARERFTTWLEMLEYTRDEEARVCGASGVDLASAILATLRHASPALRAQNVLHQGGVSTLIGDPRALQRRIARLLAPLPRQDDTATQTGVGSKALIAVLISTLIVAYALGVMYGEVVLHLLFAWTWSL
ncbi:MAG: hypothetical protein GC149_20110 [Gammaproteobacteria bacterium]|nr:hypothetical protein [Gammaproteobacteria bacterium]